MSYARIEAYVADCAALDPVIVPAFGSDRRMGPLSTDPLFDCVAVVLAGDSLGIAHGHRMRAPRALSDLLTSFAEAHDPVREAFLFGGDPLLFLSYASLITRNRIPLSAAFCDGWWSGVHDPIFGDRKEVIATPTQVRFYSRSSVYRYRLKRPEDASASTSWRSSAGVSIR